MITFLFIYILLHKNYVSFESDSAKAPAAYLLLMMAIGELISEMVWVGQLTVG